MKSCPLGLLVDAIFGDPHSTTLLAPAGCSADPEPGVCYCNAASEGPLIAVACRDIPLLIVGMCGKPKFGSDSVFKNRTVTEPSKNLTSVQTVFRQKLHANSQFMLKVTKVTLLAFKYAHKEQFKHYQYRN